MKAMAKINGKEISVTIINQDSDCPHGYNVRTESGIIVWVNKSDVKIIKSAPVKMSMEYQSVKHEDFNHVGEKYITSRNRMMVFYLSCEDHEKLEKAYNLLSETFPLNGCGEYTDNYIMDNITVEPSDRQHYAKIWKEFKATVKNM